MKVSTLIFLVVCCSAVFSGAAMLNGTSPYCRKSQLSRFYPATKKECCGHEGVCDHYIGPNETKWGLTNTDSAWIRRSCLCDVIFYLCVTRDMNAASRKAAEIHGFSQEICFQNVTGSDPTQYQFVPLMTVLRTSGILPAESLSKSRSLWE